MPDPKIVMIYCLYPFWKLYENYQYTKRMFINTIAMLKKSGKYTKKHQLFIKNECHTSWHQLSMDFI